MGITPVLDCTDHHHGSAGKTPYLTRVTRDGTIFGWFRHLVSPDGASWWNVAVCFEGRIHLLGKTDDAEVAAQLVVLGLARLRRDRQEGVMNDAE
jgi:hypothetical protein